MPSEFTAAPKQEEPRNVEEGYREYLARGKKERSPREAHLFALAMRHKGITFGLPVQEIVIALEGVLPDYWPKHAT